MKKLFNHTKRPVDDWKGYDENDYDADRPDYEEYEGEENYYEEEEHYGEEIRYIEEPYAEAEEYYAEEADAAEEAEYYAEEADAAEEAEYYAEEADAAEEAEYYAEEADAAEEAEYYAEEADAAEEAEYYAEEADAAEEAEYYAEEADAAEETEYYMEEAEYFGDEMPEESEEYYEESEYYVEEPYEEEEYYEEPEKERRLHMGFLHRLQQGLNAMGTMDKMILGTGVAVLILALVTGSLYVSARVADDQMADFVSVGSQLDGIDTIGGRGLLAVADAELARMAAAEAVQDQETEQPKEYQEAEYGRNITVSMSLTSVQKDLKIKFINKSNGKLISNVPFTVIVTGPDGKSVVWSDDDMDGIIYKKDITPGTYTVVMEALSDAQYSNYSMSETSQKVEVKKDIDYKKVDVANEIKKESEINVAKEDTKQNVTEVESTLPDTVEWVESKVIGLTYNEVSKSTIPDPATLAAAGRAGVLTTVSESTVSGSDIVQPPTLSPSPSPSPSPAVTLQGITLNKSEVTIFSTAAETVTATLTGASAAAPAVSAASADTNIATVSTSGTSVTVTGVNAGSTAVTVSYTENGKTVTANFSVTVKSHPREDHSTKLKDAGGKQLYVLDNGNYREAVYADYYTADKFFLKGDAKYTGWQTLDGKVFYFTANGDKVTGEQVIQGAKYNFASDGSLVKGSGNMGIDVSKWNGNIDWNAVSNSGVSYVIIRCGYRGSSQGKLIEDPKFVSNIQGATAAGLKVGVYFFTQAVDEVEAVEEASMVLEQIKGYKISYPVFLDVEPSGGRADSIDAGTRTAVCRAFCETIRDAGYTAGIYANKTWLTSKLNPGELSAYKIWLAQYAAEPTYTGRYDLWQYKSTGSVSGIQGKVDMNLSYLGY